MAKIKTLDARFNLKLPSWMLEGIKRVAASNVLSESDYVRGLVEKDLSRNGITKPKKTIKIDNQ